MKGRIMSNHNKIPPDVREYYERRIAESDIKRVPGHYPVLMTKEEVDQFFDMQEKAFGAYIDDKGFGETDVKIHTLIKKS